MGTTAAGGTSDARGRTQSQLGGAGYGPVMSLK